MTDLFDAEDREQAAIEAHAQALKAIAPDRVTAHVEDVVRRYGAHLPDLAGHEATIVPAVTRELLRLAAERRRVAHSLARLGGRDALDLAMLDGVVLGVLERVALAQAEARKK